MISVIQEEAVKTLRELLELHPGVRLGQLFAHLGFLGEDEFGKSIWDIDDEQMFATMRGHREELANSVYATQQEVEDEPLTPAQKAELERRLALSKADPKRGTPWEIVRDEARKRRGKQPKGQ
jgi:putative addiction module component (TIGR02574 family)